MSTAVYASTWQWLLWVHRTYVFRSIWWTTRIFVLCVFERSKRKDSKRKDSHRLFLIPPQINTSSCARPAPLYLLLSVTSCRAVVVGLCSYYFTYIYEVYIYIDAAGAVLLVLCCYTLLLVVLAAAAVLLHCFLLFMLRIGWYGLIVIQVWYIIRPHKNWDFDRCNFQ